MSRGQASLEALMWLSLAVVMALVSALAFAKGFAAAEEARANMELTSLLSTLAGAMDSATEGSVRIVPVYVPAGISSAAVQRNSSGGTALAFTFRGANYTRRLNYAAELSPANPLGSEGRKLVRVERRSGTVVISEVGNDD